VGRESEIDDASARLRSHRLVTLTGAGGIGKTRLALQVARRLRSEGAACAWIALSSTIDESELTPAIASSFFGGEPIQSLSIETLSAAVGDQKLVLILDNCEQLVAACADLVLRLLHECAGLRVLATSREPLGVPGELVYSVPPLAMTLPHEGPSDLRTEAVRLFFDRAEARDPRLRLTPETEALAARICAACDGVPLSIELAAACVGSMTLDEIADRLVDALGLLVFGSRAAPLRQRSIRASFDWSYRLLQADEQLLLRRLCVFEADFTLADAEWVCTYEDLQTIEIAYLLDRLVAQSLVHAYSDWPTMRFCMSRPVRQYGLERLEQTGELTRAQTRLTEWSAGGYGSESGAPGQEPIGEVRALPGQSPAVRAFPKPVRSTGRRVGALSEREYAVVQLVAGGRSNREIAESLVITKKTAEAHVSHILTKLGLCSRVQIATWSLLHGVAGGYDAATADRQSA
jgi:predicted ATPase/DNA-binding CsgD family transcriptional regulator